MRPRPTAITMDIADVSRRQQALNGLAADLRSTASPNRYPLGGKATARAKQAAQNAVNSIARDMNDAAANLVQMSSVLRKRIKHMRDFDCDYPSIYATRRDATREAKNLARKIKDASGDELRKVVRDDLGRLGQEDLARLFNNLGPTDTRKVAERLGRYDADMNKLQEYESLKKYHRGGEDFDLFMKALANASRSPVFDFSILKKLGQGDHNAVLMATDIVRGSDSYGFSAHALAVVSQGAVAGAENLSLISYEGWTTSSAERKKHKRVLEELRQLTADTVLGAMTKSHEAAAWFLDDKHTVEVLLTWNKMSANAIKPVLAAARKFAEKGGYEGGPDLETMYKAVIETAADTGFSRVVSEELGRIAALAVPSYFLGTIGGNQPGGDRLEIVDSFLLKLGYSGEGMTHFLAGIDASSAGVEKPSDLESRLRMLGYVRGTWYRSLENMSDDERDTFIAGAKLAASAATIPLKAGPGFALDVLLGHVLDEWEDARSDDRRDLVLDNNRELENIQRDRLEDLLSGLRFDDGDRTQLSATEVEALLNAYGDSMGKGGFATEDDNS